MPNLNPATGANPGAAPGTTAAAPPAAVGGGGFGGLLKQGTWMGPLMAIGGGAAAIAAFSKGKDGSKFLKFGGASGAVSGVGLTAVGHKASGVEAGTKATEEQAVAAIGQLTAEYEAALQAQAAAAPATPSSPAGDATGAGAGADAPGTDTAATPGATTPGTEVPNGMDTTAVPSDPAATGSGATASGPLAAVIGRTITLAAGADGSGAAVIEPGTFKIEQPAGDPAGYATNAEANAAARATMSTELDGSRFLRWLVVESGGRYYGAIAKQLGPQEQPNPIAAGTATLAAWNAISHAEPTTPGTGGWNVYAWTKDGGAQTATVPYGTGVIFQGSAAGGSPTSATTPAGTVTGGGAATPAGTFDPASVIGRTFAVNDAATEVGAVVRGGQVQLQKSLGGSFATPEEAATAARAARDAGPGGAWTRFVTLQGADGRYHLYQASIVARATEPLQGASPLHVVGAGFAEYFDGASSSWKAVADAA